MSTGRQAAATASGVATALLAGPWRRREMVRRVAVALGQARAATWVGTMVGEVQTGYPQPPVDRPRELARFLRTTVGWARGQDATPPPRVLRWEPRPTELAWSRAPVADLPDQAAVARLLDVDAGELAWFADARGLERTAAGPLRHYRWHVVPRPHGVRLLAAPKPRLKEAQRRLLRHVLARVPVHDAAHGCVPGRSVRTAVAPHAGSPVVLRMDLEAFFASVAAERVRGLLLGPAGLPEPVAHVLTSLVTTVVPAQVWREVPVPPGVEDRERHRRLGRQLAVAHLPQGAPTSPALANLVCFRLDRRLAGLAASYGARYTRYVDDLTFSGGPAVGRDRFADLVTRVVADEGFRVNAAKTAATSAARRQSVLGTVVNTRPTLPRRERDSLRALLHNCAVHGWAGQTRGREPATFRDHVLGRVAWAASLDPAFGARLHALAERVDWSAEPAG
ncbi:RNA-directed DNA polymerase from retron Mx65 (modular protein) [Modestobacter italicus]|uniref:RNA-directed DNA polymerase n=1 Tax=Modestobacter italicus (strain DSM 44449 / CECT 9708 / BC 501) TaxID=2732864 RepID=I4ET26_MODI5|nr:reverse transcriptase family protein [Modestobacter marinus]CCH86539.1 RNA-directed DNA polymerase from retron Mx65 (modular protein) [Modestobacter marinus]